jgi:hypothetical protein
MDANPGSYVSLYLKTPRSEPQMSLGIIPVIQVGLLSLDYPTCIYTHDAWSTDGKVPLVPAILVHGYVFLRPGQPLTNMCSF